MRLINSMLTAGTIVATITSVAYAAQEQIIEPGVYEIESVAKPGKVMTFPEKRPPFIYVLDDENSVAQRWTVMIPKDDDPGTVKLMQLAAGEELCIGVFSMGSSAPANMFPCSIPTINTLLRWNVKGGMPTIRFENDGVNWSDGQPRCLTSLILKGEDPRSLKVDVCRNDEKSQLWTLRRIP